MTESKEKQHVTREQSIQMMKDVLKAFNEYLYAYNEYAKNDIKNRKNWARAVCDNFVQTLNEYGATDTPKVKELFHDLNVPIHGMWHLYDDRTVHDGAVKDIERLLKEHLDFLQGKENVRQQTDEPKSKVESEVKSASNKNNFRDAVAAVLDKYDEDKKVAKKKKEEKLLEHIFGKTNQ